MRILHVMTHFSASSGITQLISALIPFQKKQGHKIDILVLAFSPFANVKELERNGCKYIVLSKKTNPKYNPLFIIKLIPYIQKYDIIHVHQFPATYWAVIARIFSAKKCKLVLTEHATLHNRQHQWFLKGIERFIYHRYDAVVAISKAVKTCLNRFVDVKLPVKIVYNGIDLKRFQNALPIPRSKLGISDDIIIVIQVARFHPPKDQITLMKALMHLPYKYHIIFVGAGDTLELHKQKAKDLGLLNRVHFMGIRNDVPALLKTADIVVMSSQYEGFGLAAVEGMAAGKPVIASGIPGLEEVVQGAGIIFPVGDDKALAKEILYLTENESFKKEVINRCLHRALRYDIQGMAQKYKNIYDNVMNNNINTGI